MRPGMRDRSPAFVSPKAIFQPPLRWIQFSDEERKDRAKMEAHKGVDDGPAVSCLNFCKTIQRDLCPGRKYYRESNMDWPVQISVLGLSLAVVVLEQ